MVMEPSNLGNPKTASETLFEEYLTANGYTDWTHERRMPGKPTTPDYELRFAGLKLFFEVKEFAAVDFPDGEGGPYDPYGPLREKVNRAARQFKHYKEFPCSLVLADPNGALVDLSSPEIVIGTMLGNIGWQSPLNAPNAPAKQVFTRGGKMVDYRRQPQNTTINAIVCLTPYKVRQRRLEIALDRRKKQLGTKMGPVEVWNFVRTVKTRRDDALRVMVFENPFARIPLDRKLFRGAWDERWGKSGDAIRRISAGRSLRRIESDLATCDRRSALQRLIDKAQAERGRLGRGE
jgi:hypothetical protein